MLQRGYAPFAISLAPLPERREWNRLVAEAAKKKKDERKQRKQAHEERKHKHAQRRKAGEENVSNDSEFNSGDDDDDDDDNDDDDDSDVAWDELEVDEAAGPSMAPSLGPAWLDPRSSLSAGTSSTPGAASDPQPPVAQEERVDRTPDPTPPRPPEETSRKQGAVPSATGEATTKRASILMSSR